MRCCGPWSRRALNPSATLLGVRAQIARWKGWVWLSSAEDEQAGLREAVRAGLARCCLPQARLRGCGGWALLRGPCGRVTALLPDTLALVSFRSASVWLCVSAGFSRSGLSSRFPWRIGSLGCSFATPGGDVCSILPLGEESTDVGLWVERSWRWCPWLLPRAARAALLSIAQKVFR